jgi:uncharacterized protein DUF4190
MANCANCGTVVGEQSRFCPSCGAAQPSPPSGPQPPSMPGMQPPMPAPYGGGYAARRTDGTAIASLVLGIAGLVICPLVCSILAIIFGNQAKSKIAVDPSLEGEGMAKAGVVLGWVGVAFTIVWIIAFVAILNSADSINIDTPVPSLPG